MKIALVCDDLTQHGGHEKVVMDFCELFPEAPLYTTVATKKWRSICLEKNINLHLSYMQKIPLACKFNRIKAVFLLHILALESFDFSDFDLIISLSSRFAHGVITKPNSYHICYMSTVGRMIWEPFSYFSHEVFFGGKYVANIVRWMLTVPLSYLRIWDRAAAQRVDLFISNSVTTRDRIKRYYNRESVVINPSITIEEYSLAEKSKRKNYFVVLSRLVPWKRIDLAISACLAGNRQLKIIGSGPDLKRLKKIAGNSDLIEFLGYVSHEEKIRQLRLCKALINPQHEDFGLVPLEAMACGCPVIAYGKGGAIETVVAGKTGLFFYEQTIQGLSRAITEFDQQNFDPEACEKIAKNYDHKIFRKSILELLNSRVSFES